MFNMSGKPLLRWLRSWSPCFENLVQGALCLRLGVTAAKRLESRPLELQIGDRRDRSESFGRHPSFGVKRE